MIPIGGKHSFSNIHCNKIIHSSSRKLLIILLPYLIPVLVILLLFFFIISVLFVLPKFIVNNVKPEDKGIYEKVVAIFTTGNRDDWLLSDDQSLYQQYIDLDLKWLNQFISQEELYNSRINFVEGNAGNINAAVGEVWGGFYDEDSGLPSERIQAKIHRVNWALLAAIDRVLGDSIITGQQGRKPDPDKHFKSLAPKLYWQDFELYYRCSWRETSADGNTVTRTKIYKHNIRLLTGVESYEVRQINYKWKKQHHYFRDPDSGYVEEAYYPVFQGSTQQGPYYEKLRKLLADNQLVKNSDLELILNLAMNYDEEFHYNSSFLSGNITELYADTENDVYFMTDISGSYLWPTGTYNTVTSAYGWRIHPNLGELKFHKGIDIACPRGTPVLAAWQGKVILTGWVSGYGRTIMINHGKYKTLYGHLDSIKVKPGQQVEQGEEIGKADSTGLSTGDHLHFEIRSGNGETSYLDPILVYKNKEGE